MTVHTDDFSGGTAGVAPSGWTARWNASSGSPSWLVQADSTAAGGKVLEYTGSADVKHVLTYDAAGSSVNDFEIVTRFKPSSVSQNGMGIVGGRIGTGATTADIDGYFVYFTTEGNDGFRIMRQLNNSNFIGLSNLYEPDVPSQNGPSASEWYYVRFSCVGTTLRAKVWNEAEHEPGWWQMTATDANLTSGYVGMFSYQNLSQIWDFWVCDDTGASISGVTGTLTAMSGDIDVTEAAYQVVSDAFAAPNIEASEAGYQVVGDNSMTITATEAAYQVVVLESSADPKVLVWTFTYDSHEFYVLELPNETLVYDTHSETWAVWGSSNSTVWKALYGIDWIADTGDILATFDDGQNALNAVVGDNTNGALYFLHPEQSMDDDNDGLDQTQFKRVLYGQIPHRGKDRKSVSAVILEGSVGQLSTTPDDLTVALEYSDDKGINFNTTGAITTTSGDVDQWLEWRSLGSLRAPGRLFRITDYGALTRIDGLDLHEDGSG